MISDNKSEGWQLNVGQSCYEWTLEPKGGIDVSTVILEHSSCDLTKLLQLHSLIDGGPLGEKRGETLATCVSSRKDYEGRTLEIKKHGLELGLLYDCILSVSYLVISEKVAVGLFYLFFLFMLICDSSLPFVTTKM